MFPAYSVEKNFILLYLSLPVLGGGDQVGGVRQEYAEPGCGVSAVIGGFNSLAERTVARNHEVIKFLSGGIGTESKSQSRH